MCLHHSHAHLTAFDPSIYMMSGSGNLRERVKNWLHLDYTPEEGDIYQAREMPVMHIQPFSRRNRFMLTVRHQMLRQTEPWNSRRWQPSLIHVRDVPNKDKAAVGFYF